MCDDCCVTALSLVNALELKDHVNKQAKTLSAGLKRKVRGGGRAPGGGRGAAGPPARWAARPPGRRATGLQGRGSVRVVTSEHVLCSRLFPAVLCAEYDRKPSDRFAGRAIVRDGPQVETTHVVRRQRVTRSCSPAVCLVLFKSGYRIRFQALTSPSPLCAGGLCVLLSRTSSEGPSSPRTTWRRRRPCATAWPSWCRAS